MSGVPNNVQNGFLAQEVRYTVRIENIYSTFVGKCFLVLLELPTEAPTALTEWRVNLGTPEYFNASSID